MHCICVDDVGCSAVISHNGGNARNANGAQTAKAAGDVHTELGDLCRMLLDRLQQTSKALIQANTVQHLTQVEDVLVFVFSAICNRRLLRRKAQAKLRWNTVCGNQCTARHSSHCETTKRRAAFWINSSLFASMWSHSAASN